MRSRPARLTLSALAWFALGAAAFFALRTHQHIGDRRSALRTFEATARDATSALGDLQSGQQAYVVAGQEPTEWMAKVAAYMQTAATSIDALRSTATSVTSGPELLDASTAMTQLANIDRKARASVETGDVQAAAETIFSEGADAVSSAVSNIDAAINGEQQATDAFEESQQRTAMYAAGGAAGFAALILALLGFASPAVRSSAGVDEQEAVVPEAATEGLSLGRAAPAPESAAADLSSAASADALRTAAELCTEFGRVRDASDLNVLLARAAAAMNARGLIVWLGSSTGADLRPVLAHGYSEQTLARLQPVARGADNVTAEAYRSGEMQIVKSRPGASQGAIVAPLLGLDGCIGALTAEIRERGEESDTTCALASIVAAQLAGALATAADGAAAAETGASQVRTANGI